MERLTRLYILFIAGLGISAIADTCALLITPTGCQAVLAQDCNSNGIVDSCDVSCGPPHEPCFGTNCGTSRDCNNNGIPDECELANGTSLDCNLNEIPDECDVDCNTNGIPDDCDLADATSPDCNDNGVPDECDIFWQQIKKYLGSDPMQDDKFGTSVAIVGDRVVVGADGEEVSDIINGGTTYVFNAQGNTSPRQRLWAPIRTDYEACGRSVAVEDETLVVGTSGITNTVYVYRGTPNVTLLAELHADNPANAAFGNAVDISGNTIVVGAYSDDELEGNSGAAYIFREFDDGWQQIARLKASDPSGNGSFGLDVAIDNDTIVIGALTDELGINTNSGSAYVFREIDGMWQQTAKLIPDDIAIGDSFGACVAIRGSTILIGAERTDSGLDDTGSVYVYREIGGVWRQVDKVLADDADRYDYFGSSVAIFGDTALIGATGAASETAPSPGAVYVFREFGGMWRQTARMTADDMVQSGLFGDELDIDGDSAIIASKFDSSVSNHNGAAYLFKVPVSADCNENGVPDECDISMGLIDDCNNNLTDDACELDCNANGIPDDCDLASGLDTDCNDNDVPDTCEPALGYSLDCNANLIPDECELDCNDNGIPDECDLAEGAAVDCNSNGVPDTCDIQITNRIKLIGDDTAENDRFGQGVALHGDHAIVSTPYHDNIGGPTGAAYVFRRTYGVWWQVAKLTSGDAFSSPFFGDDVAIHNDVLAVGAQSSGDAGAA